MIFRTSCVFWFGLLIGQCSLLLVGGFRYSGFLASPTFRSVYDYGERRNHLLRQARCQNNQLLRNQMLMELQMNSKRNVKPEVSPKPFKAALDSDLSNNSADCDKNNYVPVVLLLSALAGLAFAGQNIDFETLLSGVVSKVEGLGPYGYLYFSLVYIAAEILAIPAFPLTSSSGYLFGLFPGTLVVLSSATIAATISFYIGRTFLRSWAQNFIQSSAQWQAIDKAIGKQGFKVVLLLRLSPLLPFALSNYLYAVTSVDFWSFISATFLGFAPGSFAFVYFGSAGKDIFGDGGAPDAVPWYGYAAVGAVILFAAQTVAKVATDAIRELDIQEKMDSEDGQQQR